MNVKLNKIQEGFKEGRVLYIWKGGEKDEMRHLQQP